MTNTLAYYGVELVTAVKVYYTGPSLHGYKTFFSSSLTLCLDKLERFFKSSFVEHVLNFLGRPGAYPEWSTVMALLTNIRLSGKKPARRKHSSLFVRS